MSDKKLIFIGCGNMGQAILGGILSSGALAAGEIGAVEPADQLREKTADQFGIDVYKDCISSANADSFILAVKPQQTPAVFPQLAETIGQNPALVISIAAGISTRKIADNLPPQTRVIRTMPNTPMLVGCGCTGMCAGSGATDADMDYAEQLFASSSFVQRVTEADMDAVTAVSGSGPAYFFYMIEAMVAAGVAEGLTEQAAVNLAARTCEGAAKLLAASDVGPAELRRRVTSPGGTTEAAINYMGANNMAETITNAVKAAAARSRELG